MTGESAGVYEELKALLGTASGSYDKGQIRFLLALDAWRNHRDDLSLCEEALKHAQSASDIYDGIDAMLEKAECDLVTRYLAKVVGKRVLIDDEDNHYIEAWIEYIDSVLRS